MIFWFSVFQVRGWFSFSFYLIFFTDGLTFSSCSLWYNVDFIVGIIMASLSGPEAAKHPQTITLPSCVTVGMRFLFSNALFGFKKHTVTFETVAKQLHLWLNVHNTCRCWITLDFLIAEVLLSVLDRHTQFLFLMLDVHIDCFQSCL